MIEPSDVNVNKIANFTDRFFFEVLLTPVSEEIGFDITAQLHLLHHSDLTKCTSQLSRRTEGFWEDESEDSLCQHSMVMNFETAPEVSPDGYYHFLLEVMSLSNSNSPTLTLDEEKKLRQQRSDETFDEMSSPNAEFVTLHCTDGVDLRALKNIISLRSVVFAAMFTNNWVEKTKQSVDIIEFDSVTMAALLKFVYFGKVTSLESLDVGLYEAAKVYQVDELKRRCLTSIRDRLDQSNVSAIVDFAHFHQEDELYAKCLKLIQRFYSVESMREKVKELPSDSQIRVLTDLKTPRCCEFVTN